MGVCGSKDTDSQTNDNKKDVKTPTKDFISDASPNAGTMNTNNNDNNIIQYNGNNNSNENNIDRSIANSNGGTSQVNMTSMTSTKKPVKSFERPTDDSSSDSDDNNQLPTPNEREIRDYSSMSKHNHNSNSNNGSNNNNHNNLNTNPSLNGGYSNSNNGNNYLGGNNTKRFQNNKYNGVASRSPSEFGTGQQIFNNNNNNSNNSNNSNDGINFPMTNPTHNNTNSNNSVIGGLNGSRHNSVKRRNKNMSTVSIPAPPGPPNHNHNNTNQSNMSNFAIPGPPQSRNNNSRHNSRSKQSNLSIQLNRANNSNNNNHNNNTNPYNPNNNNNFNSYQLQNNFNPTQFKPLPQAIPQAKPVTIPQNNIHNGINNYDDNRMKPPQNRVRSLSDDSGLTNPNYGKAPPIFTHAQQDEMRKQYNNVAKEKRKMKRNTGWNEVKIPPPPKFPENNIEPLQVANLNDTNNRAIAPPGGFGANNNKSKPKQIKRKKKYKFKPKNINGPQPGDPGYDSDESIFVKQGQLERRRHSFGSSQNSSWRTKRSDLPITSQFNKNNNNIEIRKKKNAVIQTNNSNNNLNPNGPVGGFGVQPVTYKQFKRASQMQPKNIFADIESKDNIIKNNADVQNASQLMHKRQRNELGQIEGELTEKEFYKKYWIDNEKLGQGSFARVRKVTRKADGRIYALKMIKKAGKSREDLLALQREIAILSKLNDKNVVKLDDWCETDKRIYMVVEFCDGGDVFDRILKKKTFSEQEAVHVVKAVASGLKHIHNNNIIHRDLKPDNLMYLDKSENAAIKIIDFGLAGDCTNGPLSTPCGTAHYVAPEVLNASAQNPYGTKSDMWSLGVIIYMLLCGFPPFFDATGNQKRLYKLVKSGKYRFPSPYWDYVSENAKDLVRHLLMLDTKKRFSAQQVLNHKWVRGSNVTDSDLGKIYMEQMKHFSSSRKMLQQNNRIHKKRYGFKNNNSQHNNNNQMNNNNNNHNNNNIYYSNNNPNKQHRKPMNNNSNNYDIFAHKQYQPQYNENM